MAFSKLARSREIEEDYGMKITVAGVKNIAYSEIVFFADFVDATQGLGSFERGMTPSST